VGELLKPCPVLWVGNYIQCLYAVSDTFVDDFSLNSASSSVCACMNTTSLCIPYFHPAKLATAHSFLS
jgi:hypothetical protein